MIKKISYFIKALLTLIVCFNSFSYAQDVIKIDGKELKGKYVSVDFKKNRFKFIYEGRDAPIELPIDNNRLDYIKLENGKYIFKNPKIIAAEKQEEAKQKAIEEERLAKKEELLAKKEQERIRAEIKAKCDERKNIKVGLIPFQDDSFGVSTWVADTLMGMCYDVDVSMVNTISWFENKNINIRDINDYHMFNAQKELDYDIIVFGYVYTKKDAIITGHTPFTGIYVTAFYLDKSGVRDYIYDRKRVMGFY